MGKIIEIKGTKKGNSNGPWTETCLGKVTFAKGSKCYHYSDGKIKTFGLKLKRNLLFFGTSQGGLWPKL